MGVSSEPFLQYLKERMKASLIRKIPELFAAFLMFSSIGLATEAITVESHANRYFRSDLIISGEILSCTTNVIRTEQIPGDSGWTYHYSTFLKSCSVRVDSVLKGLCSDSIIVIFDESIQQSRHRFWGLDEKGDSLFVGEAHVEIDDESHIPLAGRWIIFLVDKDYDCHFLWNTEYNKRTLELYREFEEKGEDYSKEHAFELLFQE